MKVLICDDSLLIRRQLKDALEKMGGFEIHQAANGKEALDVYNRVSPHMVLLDLVMPVMNGLECLKKIKDADKRSNVVMITSPVQKKTFARHLTWGLWILFRNPGKRNNLSVHYRV